MTSLIYLANPLDRREGFVRDFVNETASRVGSKLEVYDLAPELFSRDPAVVAQALKTERARLATAFDNPRVLFSPGSSVTKLTLNKVKLDKLAGTLEDVSTLPKGSIPHKVLCTWDPGEMRDGNKPHYRGVFERHLWKAGRYAAGTAPEFRWPETVTLETHGESGVLQAAERLLSGDAPLGVDVETPKIGERDFFEKARRLLNVGFGCPVQDLALSVTWPAASPVVKTAVLELLASKRQKVMHNGSFDASVFAVNRMPIAAWDFDTMEIWRFLFPRLLKSLRFVSGFLTWAPDWKEEFKASTKENALLEGDEFVDADAQDRAIYNARDSWLQALCWQEMRPIVERRHKGLEQIARLSKCLGIGVRMFYHGIPVNAEAREAQRAPLQAQATAAKEALISKVKAATAWDRDTLGDFNPNATRHVRWLFGQLGVPSPKKTKKGAESFDAEALVKLSEHPAPTVAELARALLDERAPKKLLSTYVDGLPVHSDGRIHPRWIPLGTLTGRWASRDPNAQNIPGDMYSMFEAPPGLWWVKVDKAGYEARIAAMFAGEERLIQAFVENADVHTMNARLIFGLPPGAKVTKAMRQFAKSGQYAWNYGAADKTVLARVKVDEGIPLDLRQRMGLPEIAEARFKWFQANPRLKARQEATLRAAIENRYVEEPFSGRRCYFIGEVDVSVVFNFPIQTFAGFDMNEGIIRLDSEIRWGEGEAILDQVHDSITIVGPDPRRLFELAKGCLESEYEFEGHRMTYPIEGKIGRGALSGGIPFKVGEGMPDLTSLGS